MIRLNKNAEWPDLTDTVMCSHAEYRLSNSSSLTVSSGLSLIAGLQFVNLIRVRTEAGPASVSRWDYNQGFPRERQNRHHAVHILHNFVSVESKKMAPILSRQPHSGTASKESDPPRA